MTQSSVESVVRALQDAQVRYLIVGGVAVVAHGYVRFTADIDIVLSMDDTNLAGAVAALAALDYRPRAPVPFEDFISADKRADWIREKALTVFSVFSPTHPATELDLFVEPPFDFDTAHGRRLSIEFAEGLVAAIVGREDLLRMKRAAGRAQDLEDVRQLSAIAGHAGGTA